MIIKSKFIKILGIALALGMASSTTFAKTTIDNQNVLNDFAKATNQRKTVALGYPCSQELQLTGFYKWL